MSWGLADLVQQPAASAPPPAQAQATVPAQGTGQPAGGQMPVVQPHPAPNGSGWTNLSDEDFWKFQGGQTGGAAPQPAPQPQKPGEGHKGASWGLADLANPEPAAPPADAQPPGPSLVPQQPQQAPVPDQPPQQQAGKPSWGDIATGLIGSTAATLGGIPRGIVGGTGADYVDAALQTPIRMLTGMQGPSAAFNQGLQSAQQRHAELSGQYPIANTMGELAGGIGAGVMAAPSLAYRAPAAAGMLPKAGAALDYLARNAAFGGAMSGLNGGDVGTGAGIGAGAAALLPGLALAAQPVKAVYRTVAPMVSSSARDASVAGNLARDLAPGQIQTSPVGPLDLAQATNNPQIAAKVRYAQGIAPNEATALRNAQAAATRQQIDQIGAPASMAEASDAFTRAVRAARDVAGKEESRLWTVPALAETKINPYPIQKSVSQAYQSLDPVLRDNASPQIKALVNQLSSAPATTLRDLNSIRKDLEQIARTSADGTERMVARRLSSAFLEGLDSQFGAAPMAPAASPAGISVGRAAPPAAAPVMSAAGRRRAPESLVDFLIAKGGVQDQGGDLRSLGADAIHHRAAGRLVNSKGLSPDYAREAAVEAGFLKPNATVSDLYDAIGEHISGRPVYRISEQAEAAMRAQEARQVALHEEALRRARWAVNDVEEARGLRLSPQEMDHATDLTLQGMHPDEAVESALYARDHSEFQRNAQVQALSPTGMPLGSWQGRLPEPDSSVAPISEEIKKAYQEARDYTRQMRTMFGAPDFKSALAKTPEGVFRKDASEGARSFFNFSNGSPEGSQSIAELSNFVGSLKQAGAAQVSQDMRDAARSYVASALTKAARLEEGQVFNPKTMQDFLRKNGDWMRKSGMFEKPQIEAAERLMDYADKLRRTEALNAQGNSATQQRQEVAKTFVDEIMSPWTRRLLEFGAMAAGGHAHGGLGAVIGGVAGAGFEGAVKGAESAMRETMAEALFNPQVAKDLLMKASPGNARFLSAPTRELLSRVRISIGADVLPQQFGGSNPPLPVGNK